MKRIRLPRLRLILGTRNIQIHHNRLLPASHQHRLHRHIRARIQLLMRHVRRYLNEIPRPSFIHKLQLLAPAQPRAPPHDVNHGLKFSMMMRPSLRARMNRHRPSPKLLRPHSRMRNSLSPCHPARLRRVRVQLPAANNPHAVILPVRLIVHRPVPSRASSVAAHSILHSVIVGRGFNRDTQRPRTPGASAPEVPFSPASRHAFLLGAPCAAAAACFVVMFSPYKRKPHFVAKSCHIGGSPASS